MLNVKIQLNVDGAYMLPPGTKIKVTMAFIVILSLDENESWISIQLEIAWDLRVTLENVIEK